MRDDERGVSIEEYAMWDDERGSSNSECVMRDKSSTHSQVLNDSESDKGKTHGQILNQVLNDGRLMNEGILKNDRWVVRHVRRDSIMLRKQVLIKDGKYCYIDYLDQYIKRKRRHLTQAYCDQLLRIKHR